MRDLKGMSYPANIAKDGNGYLVTFRDVDNAFTCGSTSTEACANAREVLEMILLDRVKTNDEFPKPSKARKGEVIIHL